MSGKRRTKQMKNQPIVARAAVVTSAGVTVADWQRLPRQLLHDHIQKTKTYNKPEYHNARCSEDGKHRCRVVLNHAKNNERTLKFAPKEGYDSFELAKEYAALLALSNLCAGLALDRKLPEPFRSAWLSLSSATPAVTSDSRFHSEYDRQQAARDSVQRKNRSANVKEARKHFTSGQQSRLMLDNEHRQILEHVVQKSSSQDEAQKQPVLLPAKLSALIISELTNLGFRQDDVDRALSEAPFSDSDSNLSSARNTTLQWLLVNIAERRLPSGYRAKDSSAIIANRGAIGAIENISLVDQLRRLGYPTRACEAAARHFPESYRDAKLWLWTMIVTFICPPPETSPDLKLSSDELQSEIEAERLALSAIYDDSIIFISDLIWEIQLQDLQLRIRFELPPGYPSVIPIIDVSAEHLFALDCVCIQQALIVEVVSPAVVDCSPVVYSCVEFLRQNLDRLLESSRPRWPSDWILAPSLPQLPSKPGPVRSTKPSKSPLNPAVIETQNEALRQVWRHRSEKVEFVSAMKEKGRLPVWRHRHRVIEAVHDHQVVVICAETGSGKSTQIPSFLLDESVERGHGATCRIICAQPRRISAISLAERVAHEYCEKVGETVGYRIRLESKISKDTRIEYVTNGLLLRQLLSDQDLSGVSHVVLDEVHERSVEIDLLLLILRKVVTRRTDFRLVLMSATLQSDLLSSYFNGCPVVQVPGRAFPVQLFFVEDLIESTGYFPSEKYRSKEKRQLVNSESLDESALSEQTRLSVNCLNPNLCNTELIIVAIWHAISAFPSESGAILCFLPGVREITHCIRQFTRSILDHQCKPSDFMLVPLHGSLSTSEQGKVFQRPPSGARKIVFATNVAETSVTVNDVVCVIDSGRMRQTQFDVGRNVSMLVDTFVSRSNAEQRRGRAGRVRSGICIRLFTRQQYGQMPNEHPSEMSRVSLDHVCLQIRGLHVSSAPLADIFGEMIEPPDPGSIHRAIHTLQTIGAFLPDSEELSALGRHLCSLPMDARLSKMVILSACFCCVTPIVRIAALLSVANPFLGGADHRENVSRIRLGYAASSNSDHIALLRLFEDWLAARAKSSESAAQFCRDNLVSDAALRSAVDVSQQYCDALRQLGFISMAHRSGKADLGIDSVHDQNASQLDLVMAVLTAGLYPNVVRVQYPEQRFQQTLTGTVAKAPESHLIRYYRSDGHRVFLHPSSVNFKSSSYKYPYLAYIEQRQTSKLFIYDSSVMPPYSLLMFAGRIDCLYDTNQVMVDKWLKLNVSGRVAALVNSLRQQLNQILDDKFHEPDFDIISHDVTKAIVTLFVSGGGFT